MKRIDLPWKEPKKKNHPSKITDGFAHDSWHSRYGEASFLYTGDMYPQWEDIINTIAFLHDIPQPLPCRSTPETTPFEELEDWDIAPTVGPNRGLYVELGTTAALSVWVDDDYMENEDIEFERFMDHGKRSEYKKRRRRSLPVRYEERDFSQCSGNLREVLTEDIGPDGRVLCFGCLERIKPKNGRLPRHRFYLESEEQFNKRAERYGKIANEPVTKWRKL